MSVTLLTLAASFRADSLNRQLLAQATAVAEQAGATVTPFDYAHADLPLYREETAAAVPAGATAFIEALLAADGILLASPEYNWSMPGSLKNLIDWVSIDARKPFQRRYALLMCASPSVRGGILGLQQLQLPLAHLGMHVYPHLVALGDAQTQLATGTTGKDMRFMQHCVQDFVAHVGAARHE